jgi:hypothetical protein
MGRDPTHRLQEEGRGTRDPQLTEMQECTPKIQLQQSHNRK